MKSELLRLSKRESSLWPSIPWKTKSWQPLVANWEASACGMSMTWKEPITESSFGIHTADLSTLSLGTSSIQVASSPLHTMEHFEGWTWRSKNTLCYMEMKTAWGTPPTTAKWVPLPSLSAKAPLG